MTFPFFGDAVHLGGEMLGEDATEPGFYATLVRHEARLREVFLEHGGFVVHHFPMLHWFVIQKSVQLNRLVRCCGVLVLSGELADPEMHIILELILVRVLVGVEDDV